MPIIKVQERPAPQGTRDGEFTVHPGASQGGPGCLRGAAPVSPGDAARPELRPRTGARGGATVLIVDDSPSIRRRVRAALEDGRIRHLVEPPAYHGNPISAEGSLVTYDFGFDLAGRLDAAAGTRSTIHALDDLRYGIRAEYIEVVVSVRPAA